MKRKIIRIVFFTVVLLLPVYTVNARPGAAWLEIGPGGRAAGLAETMTASVEGPTATYWNPAAVGLTGSGAEAMLSEWIAGAHSQFVTAGFKLGDWGLGASVLHVGVGDLELRDGPTTEPIGTFESRSYGLGLTLARTLPIAGLRFGVTGRYLSDAIYVYSGSGWAMDMGLLKDGLFDGRLDLGAAVRHLGKMDALDEESYDLPTTMSAGLRWHLGSFGLVRPSLMTDLVKVRDQEISLRGAVEAAVSELFFLRGGYATGYDARGLSAGFGLRWKGWRFDYGYTPFSADLGDAQRFSVAILW